MYKDLLVHLDGSAEDETRLAYAEYLALQNDGHLTGLYCNMLPSLVVSDAGSMSSAAVISQWQTDVMEEGKKVAARLKERMRRLAVLNEFRHLDLFSGQMGTVIASEAHAADVFISTRPYGQSLIEPQVIEQIIFNSGRATLLVPPGGKAEPEIDTVLVAWRNTREAARAVSEAMPLLVKARRVVVVSVSSGESAESRNVEPAADIAKHLVRHGVNVELRQVAGWDDPARAILHEQGQAMAGLIVMGVYGHSRFREWVLGGVTRDILSTATVPVLVAH